MLLAASRNLAAMAFALALTASTVTDTGFCPNALGAPCRAPAAFRYEADAMHTTSTTSVTIESPTVLPNENRLFERSLSDGNQHYSLGNYPSSMLGAK